MYWKIQMGHRTCFSQQVVFRHNWGFSATWSTPVFKSHSSKIQNSNMSISILNPFLGYMFKTISGINYRIIEDWIGKGGIGLKNIYKDVPLYRGIKMSS